MRKGLFSSIESKATLAGLTPYGYVFWSVEFVDWASATSAEATLQDVGAANTPEIVAVESKRSEVE